MKIKWDFQGLQFILYKFRIYIIFYHSVFTSLEFGRFLSENVMPKMHGCFPPSAEAKAEFVKILQTEHERERQRLGHPEPETCSEIYFRNGQRGSKRPRGYAGSPKIGGLNTKRTGMIPARSCFENSTLTLRMLLHVAFNLEIRKAELHK